MASYNIVITTVSGDPSLSSADLTGSGTSGDPWIVAPADTVKFTHEGPPLRDYDIATSNPTIFTSALNIQLNDLGASSTQTIAAGSNLTDTISVQDDLYPSSNETLAYIRRETAASIGDPPVSRDHGNNRYVKREGFDGNAITYAAAEPSTTFYGQSTLASTAVALFTTSSTAPQRGTFSMSSYLYVYADKPIHLMRQSLQHNVIPTTLQGQVFAHYATRNTPATIYIFNPSDTNEASVTVYVDNVSNSGIYGTSSLVNGSTNLAVQTESWATFNHSLTGTWVYFTSDEPVVAAAQQNGVSDRMALPPMSPIQYTRRVGSNAIINKSGTPSTHNDKVVFDTSGCAVMSIRVGDGSGSDAAPSLGAENISNTYLFGDNPRDFQLGVPNSNKIVVERWDATATEWVIEEYFDANGTATDPVRFVRSASTGFYVAGTTNSPIAFSGDQIWRWRGEDVFYVGFNDAFADEEPNFGYTTTYVAPVISSVTNNNAESASVVVTVNTSSTGSGGVLKYGFANSSTPPTPRDSSGSSAWQTGNTFTQERGTTVYYFASQAENFSAAFAVEAEVVGYIDPASVDCANQSISSQFSGNLAVSISGGIATKEAYTVALSADIASANVIANSLDVINPYDGSDFSIPSGNLPTPGNTTTYYVYSARFPSYGGDGAFDQVSSFTVTRASVVATPTNFAVTNPITQGQVANGTQVTYNLTADALSGHTLEFQKDSGGFTSTTSYTQAYATESVYEARYVRTSDGEVSPTPASITRKTDDPLITITLDRGTSLSADVSTAVDIASFPDGTADTQYRLRALADSNLDGTFISVDTNVYAEVATASSITLRLDAVEQPAQGFRATYQIMSRVRTTENGDGIYRQLPTSVTNATFTIQKEVAEPTEIVIGSDPGTRSQSVSLTVTASGGSITAETIQVSEDNSNWVANGSSFEFIRGSNKTLYARRISSCSIASPSFIDSKSAGYIAPDTSITLDFSVSSISPGTTIVTASVRNATDGEQILINTNDENTSLSAQKGVGTATISGATANIQITDGELPSLSTANVTAQYLLYVRNPTASGGNNTYVSTGVTGSIERRAFVTPTDIVFQSDPGTRSKSVALTVTASGGAEGTLQVSEDNTNWDSNGTSYEFTRNTAKTLYARRIDGSEVSSTYSEATTLPYISEDGNVQFFLTASSISPGATADIIATIRFGNEGDLYQLRTADSNTPLASGTSVGSDPTDSSLSAHIIISSGEQPSLSTADITAQYELRVQTPEALGGSGTYSSIRTASITRRAFVTPTDIVFQSDPGTRSQSVALTVTASGGAEGTLQVSEDNTNWSSNGTSFEFTRNTAKTLYARRIDGSEVSSTYSEANTINFIPPDTSVTLAFSASSISPGSTATVTASVTNATDGEVILLNTNDTNTSLGSQQGVGTATISGGTAGITITGGELPSLSTANVTAQYLLYVKNPTASGGSDNFVSTSITGSIERRAFVTPTDIVFQSDPGTRSKSVALTVTASGGAEGTLQVSEDNTNWSSNGTSFEFTRNTAKTLYARRIDGSEVSSTYSEANTIPYIDPDLSLNLILSSSSISPGATSTVDANFSGATSGDIVRLVTTDTNTPLAAGTSVGTDTVGILGTGTIAITSGELPDVKGTTAQYEVEVQTPEALGGAASYTKASITASIERRDFTTPTDIVFGSDPGTASASAFLTVTASGGAEGTLQVSEDNSNWDSNGTSYEFTRNTAKTLYARRIDGSEVSSTYSEANTLSYLATDTSISAIVPGTIAANAGDQTVKIQEATSTTDYRVVLTSNNSVLTSIIAGNGTVTLSDSQGDLPLSGASKDYNIQANRAISAGGDGAWKDTTGTNNSFTITRSAPTAPTDVDIAADPGTRAASISLTVTAAGSNGDSMEVSEDNTNWVANGSSFDFIRGTAKTIYGRGLTDGTASTSTTSAKTLAYIAPDTNVDVALSQSSISPGFVGGVTCSIRNTTTGERYRILTTNTNTVNGTTNFNCGTASSNTATTLAINLNYSEDELPDVNTGVTAQYKLQARNPIELGGDLSWNDTGDTFGIERQVLGAPTSVNIQGDPGTTASTVALTVSAAGATNFSGIQLSESADFGTTQNNDTTFNFRRNISKTIHARSFDGSVVSSAISSSKTLAYIAGDASASATPDSTTIANNYASSLGVTVAGGSSGTQYQLVRYDGSATVVGTRDGNGTISIASGNLPTAGVTAQYRLEYAVLGINGGNESFVEVSPVSQFTVFRSISATITADSGTTVTEGGTLQFTFNCSPETTYYWDIQRDSGSVGGGELTPTSGNFTGTGCSVTLTFTNDSTTEIGFQGEDFTLTLSSGSGTNFDSVSFTVFDDDSGITYTDSTIEIFPQDTDHTIGIVRATGDSSASVSARVVVDGTTTALGGEFTLATGTTNRSVPDAPTIGNTTTYRVQVYNGNEFINGPTYTVSNSAAPNTGGAPATARDHGNGEWICVENGSVRYGVPEDGTTITEEIIGGSTSSKLAATSGPASGNFNVTAGRKYYSNKPFHIVDEAENHRVIPLSFAAREFGDYHNRYDDQIYYFFSETAGEVNIYDDVTGGLATGTPNFTLTLPANTVTTYTRDKSKSSTWIFFASNVDMVMSKETTGGGDKHVLSPAADIFYSYRSQYDRTTNNTVPTSTDFSVSDNTYRVVSVSIGDGAGGDSEQGLGDHNLSNTHVFGNQLTDFQLLAPNTNTIVIESWNGSSWSSHETFNFTGTSTSPGSAQRTGDAGFGVQSNSASGLASFFNSDTLWRWRGTDVFYCRVNDTNDDEEVLFGYTSSITAPSGISVTNDNASASAVTTTVNLTASGSGGALKYAQTATNSVPSTGWQNANTFSHERGSTFYYWASQNEDGSPNGTQSWVGSGAVAVGYIAPDSAVGGVPSFLTLSSAETTTVISLTGTISGETYEVRRSGTPVGSTTASGTNTDITVTHGVAEGGSNNNFDVHSSRPKSLGGDGLFDLISGTTFSIFRQNTFTFTDLTDVALSSVQTSNTITASGIATTASVSVTGGEYSRNGGAYTSTAGTAVNGDNFTVRHTTPLAASTATNTTLTVGQEEDTFTTTTKPLGGDLTPATAQGTEGDGTFTFSASVVYGTYNWQVTRAVGSGGGAITDDVTGGEGTFTDISKDIVLTIVDDSTGEVGTQGEDFVLTLRTGASVGSGTFIDSSNFTIFDDDTGISYTNGTITASAAATSHIVGVIFTTQSSDTAATARIRNVTTDTIIGSTFTLNPGTNNRTVNDNPDEGIGDQTETYRVEVYNGNEYLNGPTYTVTTTDASSSSFTQFPPVFAAPISSDIYSYQQVLSTTQAVTVARTSGTATFAISAFTTRPSSGSFDSTSKECPVNNYIHVKTTSPSTTSTDQSSRFTIGSLTNIPWAIKTEATAGSGGDPGAGGGSGGLNVPQIESDPDYGVAIYDTDGSTLILSPFKRHGVILARQQLTLTSANPTQKISLDMTGITEANTIVLTTGRGWPVDVPYYDDTVTFVSDGIEIEKSPDLNSDWETLVTVIRF